MTTYFSRQSQAAGGGQVSYTGGSTNDPHGAAAGANALRRRRPAAHETMPAFIFMLTRDDRTVPDALDVYRRVRDVPNLRYVGFKDVGLPLDQLKRLAAEIRDAGQAVLLEVVSLSEADELNSARGAVDIGVDYLLGGTRPEKVIPLLAGSGIRYFPFCGRTIGHPTQLRGTVEEIVADAARLAAMPGVSGLDLLAYRYDGDVERLTAAVTAAVRVPVIAAGSIDRVERIESVGRCGAWGFTVGGAIFEGRFGPGPVTAQVRTVLEASAGRH